MHRVENLKRISTTIGASYGVNLNYFVIFNSEPQNPSMKKIVVYLAFPLVLLSCSSSDDNNNTSQTPTEEAMYFPPLTGDTWDTKSVTDLNWHQDAVQPLLDFLEQKHTKGFMILVNGRIVMESYFNGHSATAPWYWASAGKTLTSAVTGIAQKENYIDIDNKVSDYLGAGWTSLPLDKENLITNRNLLTMTSGIDDDFDEDCTDPTCLIYKADAGTRWAYDNVYVKLQDVIASATGQSWEDYFSSVLKNKIGMTGTWIPMDGLSVYYSTTRSMARFGLLFLNKGKWDTQEIVPADYFNQATTPSQTINNSYGYLWWINGQANYHLPQSQVQIPGSLIPGAPADMFMALGKNDQKIYVVPSRKMVVIRMGDVAEGANFALSQFDDDLWEKINAVIN
jgi:CubicO group peptidase (beta-lactamase class C family)